MPYLASLPPRQSDGELSALGLSPDAREDQTQEASEFSQEARCQADTSAATAAATAAAATAITIKPLSATTPSTSSSSTATLVRHVGPRIDLLAPVGPTASAGRSSPRAPSFASPRSSPSISLHGSPVPVRDSMQGESKTSNGNSNNNSNNNDSSNSSNNNDKSNSKDASGAALPPSSSAAATGAMKECIAATSSNDKSSDNNNSKTNSKTNSNHSSSNSKDATAIDGAAVAVGSAQGHDEGSARRDMRFRPPGGKTQQEGAPVGSPIWVEADLDCDEAKRSVEPRAGLTSRGASMGPYQDGSPRAGPQLGLHPSRGQYAFQFDSGAAAAGPRITSPAVGQGEGDSGPSFGGTVVRRGPEEGGERAEATRSAPAGTRPAKSVHTVDWQTLQQIRSDLCRIACLKAAARMGRDVPVDGNLGPLGPGSVQLEQELPVSAEDLVNSWVDIADREQLRLGSGPLPARDREFIEIRVAQSMREVDPQCTGYVDVDIWVHHMLLTRSSPTVMRAMLQVNRLLEVSMSTCPGVLVVLQHAFDVARHTAADAAPPQEGAFEIELWDSSSLRNVRLPFREVISVYAQKLWHFRPGSTLAEGHRPLRKTDFSQRTPDHFIHNVVQALEVDGSTCICPGDFLGLCLGRREWEVCLHLYDLSKGLASAISPWLLPDALEGIWHTGIVVYGKEYYFGGDIYYDTPGETGFGKPRISISLGTTLCQRDELHGFIVEELKPIFTREAYDAACNNCNHFTDRVCMFLLGKHIPEEVLRQPEIMLSTTLGRTLRPILTRLLGQYFVPKSSSEEITFDGTPKSPSNHRGPGGADDGAKPVDHFDRTYAL